MPTKHQLKKKNEAEKYERKTKVSAFLEIIYRNNKFHFPLLRPFIRVILRRKVEEGRRKRAKRTATRF